MRVCVCVCVKLYIYIYLTELYAPYCPDGACLTCALVCFLHADFTNSYLEFRSGELPQKSDSSRFQVSGFGFR